MRTACLSLFAIALAASPAIAKDASRVRPATETEIRQTLKRSAELQAPHNGFQYREGSAIGYQISDGRICVLQQKKKSCVDVYSDGKRLETIDSRGNRAFLN